MNRNSCTPPFAPNVLPAWRCPACPDGALMLDPHTLRTEETAESRKNHDHMDWEPEWIQKRFSALLKCTKCSEPVFFVGSTVLIEDFDDRSGWHLIEALKPTFFEPPSTLIHIPNECPPSVSEGIIDASRLYWASPSSAANRLRESLERLMDDRGVPKKRKNKHGRYDALTLHSRIEKFSAKVGKDLGETLLAVKWLGNSGSHSNELSADNALDGFELLENALSEIYESKTAKLQKLKSNINKNKGPSKKA